MQCMLGYQRKGLSAETLEAFVFMRLNMDLVTNEVTSKAVRNARGEEIDDEEGCNRLELYI
ncbi:hypothetical protein JG688_00009048 [Phytophthora aleatoria]|uniref:Uncharacterized protein n=1 Tax=Phytophthora aleatoria TaxID=2496075 RepID=A0A8J5IM49_9STRA|nr:hypothetical protein JG688_00009048 [Phytophthora aleatoria]